MSQFFERVVDLAIPIALVIAILVGLLVLRSVLYRCLGKITRKTRSDYDDILLRGTRGASLLWCFLAAVYAGLKLFDLPETWIGPASKVLTGFFIISLALVASSVAGIFIKRWASRTRVNIQITSLAENLARGLIIIIGVLILLDTIGVKITSLIAALGIGSLAVALALQDTLSNLFSGAYIILSRNIRGGDYIKLDSGNEGYVVDIGWRATTIRPFDNTIVIVPNSKLSQSIIINYMLPEPWITVYMPINVSYDTDIEKLERIMIEEGKKALREIPGMLPDYEPVLRFSPGFGEFSLNFLFIFRVKEFVDQYYAQHELRKRLLKRFRQEGITIPFPTRTVHMDQLQGIKD